MNNIMRVYTFIIAFVALIRSLTSTMKIMYMLLFQNQNASEKMFSTVKNKLRRKGKAYIWVYLIMVYLFTLRR